MQSAEPLKASPTKDLPETILPITFNGVDYRVLRLKKTQQMINQYHSEKGKTRLGFLRRAYRKCQPIQVQLPNGEIIYYAVCQALRRPCTPTLQTALETNRVPRALVGRDSPSRRKDGMR